MMELTRHFAPATDRKKVLVIVPAYNEEANLPRLLAKLRDESPFADVLVVNDGSCDRTGAVAAAAGVAVVNLPCNLGIGGAVQTGFKYAARLDYRVALQVDGDGQHKPSAIASLIEPILQGDADMVIGSRFLSIRSFRSSALRRVGIGLFSVLNSWLIGRRITDNTSGFRAYSQAAITFLAQNYPSDYPEPEAVILLGKNGFSISEIAVEMQERQGGHSTITPLKSVYYMVKVVLAILMCACRAPVITGAKR